MLMNQATLDFSVTADGTTARLPIRVGILGLGRQTQFHTVPELRRLEDKFHVMAVCDVEKDRRDVVQGAFPDARYYRRIEDAIDDPEIDLFVVALPTAYHAKTAMSCLRHGKWTLVENPLALAYDAAQLLRAASLKSENKLIVAHRPLFSTAFRLARLAREDPRLGDVYDVRVRHQSYVRRNDWECIKRCAGGCVFREGPDALMEAILLLGAQPSQIWSDMKRVAGLGDAEDYLHVTFRTLKEVSADVEINAGHLPPFEPRYTIRGSRGLFTVAAGTQEGTFHVIDPEYKLPRRRSSVRVPPLNDMTEPLPQVDIPLQLPAEEPPEETAFWEAVYKYVRENKPLPFSLDDAAEVIRYLQIVKQASNLSK